MLLVMSQHMFDYGFFGERDVRYTLICWKSLWGKIRNHAFYQQGLSRGGKGMNKEQSMYQKKMNLFLRSIVYLSYHSDIRGGNTTDFAPEYMEGTPHMAFL